jgi:UDP-N-acetylmuramate--alanine ligase
MVSTSLQDQDKTKQNASRVPYLKLAEDPRQTRVHFIGIGGYGMSAIAKVMLEMGYEVTGSDVAVSELTEKLTKLGAKIAHGHDAANVTGSDLVVYSTATAADNVERVAATNLSIPVLHRSDMLAQLLNQGRGIAVAGAHGKTTTSSMIALVLELSQVDPTFIIGGEIVNLGTNAQAGNSDIVVAEADESDGSFLKYYPFLAVVTNIEPDHLEHYDGNYENLKRAYRQFLSQVVVNGAPGARQGQAIVNSDDPLLAEIVQDPQMQVPFITYGITNTAANYVARNIVLGDRSASFELVVHPREEAGALRDPDSGVAYGTVHLSVPGMHNVSNALATFAACHAVGLSFDAINAVIGAFRGAKRRFQVVYDAGDLLVVDDYAHHPTEIATTLAAAKDTGKRVIAVFQPQRYSRTYFLFDEFSRAFAGADEVIITDIYAPAGEAPIAGVNAERLAAAIKANSNPNTTYIGSRVEAEALLGQRAAAGNLILTMGAGDIWRTAHGLAAHFSATYAKPSDEQKR